MSAFPCKRHTNKCSTIVNRCEIFSVRRDIGQQHVLDLELLPACLLGLYSELRDHVLTTIFVCLLVVLEEKELEDPVWFLSSSASEAAVVDR